MTHVEWDSRPEVVHPVMICAFAGWNDGGEAASASVRYLRDQWRARRFARIDPEEFFDFQVNRPTVRLVNELTRRIEWPSNDFSVARSGTRDVVVFLGAEPNLRWRTYCDEILGVARELDVELLVTLGAFLADVPHTIPAPVSAGSQDPRWLAKPGVIPARYEGPTGIVGVLNDQAARAGITAVSLWGAAPHYLSSSANPKVALALLERLRDLVRLEIDVGDMEHDVRRWERQVEDAIGEDGNLAGYIRRLEEVAETGVDPGEETADMPSGEDLAAELERYLRERGDGDL